VLHQKTEYICADLSSRPQLFPCSETADHTYTYRLESRVGGESLALGELRGFGFSLLVNPGHSLPFSALDKEIGPPARKF
jgi:hypothetical protein